MFKKARSIFEAQHGYATAKDIHKRVLKKLLDDHLVQRIKRGLYRWNELADGTDEEAEVCRLVPAGVLCLFSAWHFHDLTTFVPHEYHLAIEKSTKVRLPEFPPIKLYYRDKTNYALGIVDTGLLRVYDLEKSVCDAVKYRNKTGMDTLSEVLKNYLQRPDKNLDRLLKYAKLLRVEQTLNELLLILL